LVKNGVFGRFSVKKGGQNQHKTLEKRDLSENFHFELNKIGGYWIALFYMFL
jgi:hypothetical protein